MKENKSSISNAASYKEIGAFWDEYNLTEFRYKTKPVDFLVDIHPEKESAE